MKVEIILLVCYVVFTVAIIRDGKNMLEFEGEGSGEAVTNINNIIKKMNNKIKNVIDETDALVGSGNDDEDSKDDTSGSGSGLNETDPFSGRPEPTKETSPTGKETSPTVIDITLVSTDRTTTMGNEVELSGDDDDDDDENTTEIVGDTQHGDKTKDKKKSGVNFTVGIIVGVVVGAILAILIIVFLVYRLRKKDEGSYSLDEQSSTAYLRADTDSPTKGKEYFA